MCGAGIITGFIYVAARTQRRLAGGRMCTHGVPPMFLNRKPSGKVRTTGAPQRAYLSVTAYAAHAAFVAFTGRVRLTLHGHSSAAHSFSLLSGTESCKLK